jgi:hypothetical protein
VELGRSPLLHLGEWIRGPSESSLPSSYRFLGEVEAIEGRDRLWVRGAELTAIVEMGRGGLYLLADGGGSSGLRGGGGLVERIPWKRIHVLPEGGRLFVGGAVRIEDGKPVFHDSPGQPLLVVSYEGPDSSLLPRLISGGRRSNEYWNPLSRASFALGIGIEAILLAAALGSSWLPTILLLAFLVSLTPLLGFLPPGLAFFFLYLRLWRMGLESRIMRDLCLLPLRFFSGREELAGDGSRAVPLPEGGAYVRSWTEGPLPEGIEVLEGEGETGWTLFTPELSSDYAVRRIAIAGIPEVRARDYSRRALLATLGSGLALFLALGSNMAVAVYLWRLF